MSALEPRGLTRSGRRPPCPWSPFTVATTNDDDLRVVRTQGEVTRHSHPETDGAFLVLSGSLTIRLDDGEVTSAPDT